MWHGADCGGTLKAKSRSPAHIANTGPMSIEMRPITNGSGIAHDSHCSLLFMTGLEEILPHMWNILFSL